MTVEGDFARGLSSFTSRELRYVTTLADTLNFHRAAELLYISQPSLSRQIRVVEARIGVRLFDRSTRTVRLTPAGRLFSPLARALLESLETAVLMAHNASRRPGAIRLMHSAEGSSQASRFITSLRANDPLVEIHTHEVRAGELDWTGGAGAGTIGIGTSAGAELTALAWAADPVVAVLPHGHELCGHGPLPMAELARYPLGALGPEDAPGLRARLSAAGTPVSPQVIDGGTEELFLGSQIVVLDVASRCAVLGNRFETFALLDVAPVEFFALVSPGSPAAEIAGAAVGSAGPIDARAAG